jgi:hypothetical protein
VRSKLTATLGTWSGMAPMTYSYRWQRCSVTGSCMSIYGVLGATYRPTCRDLGYEIVVVVTAVNPLGTGRATAPATAPVKQSSGTGASASTAKSRDAWDANWATLFALVGERFGAPRP